MLRTLMAHSGAPLAPHDLWSRWTFEPAVVIGLLALLILYALGVAAVWRRAGVGRGISADDTLRFAAAWWALVVALVSPLDALSGALFSAHMTQHLVLSLVAAPLLLMSNIPLALLWLLPRETARSLAGRVNRSARLARFSRALTSPLVAWALFALALWAWHAPGLYQAALANDAIHALEHATLLGSAMLFWWVLLRPAASKEARYTVAIPYLFTTILHSGVLGALIMFSSQPWYPYYASLTPMWGLTPLQDQQLAGLIMWVPGGFVFTGLTIGYFAAWLRALEKRHAG